MKAVAVCGVAVLLTCSMALGSGRKPVDEPKVVSESTAAAKQPVVSLMDSFPDAVSYPAVGFGAEVTGEEAARLTALVGGPSDYDAKSGRLAVYRQWWEAEEHSLLESIAPGVRLLMLKENDPRMRDYVSEPRCLVLSGGKLYGLDALNRLLLDAGFSFDSIEMTLTAKVAVLFATFGRSPLDTHFYRRGVPIRPPPGFPAITFLSVKRDTWRPKGSSIWDGTWVDCLIDGSRERVFVSFWGADKRGQRQPERVWGAGLNFMPGFARFPK